jgi:hypothetical protein
MHVWFYHCMQILIERDSIFKTSFNVKKITIAEICLQKLMALCKSMTYAYEILNIYLMNK